MPAIYHEGSWLGNATDPEVLVKDTVGWTGKNRAYSQTNNAVIAHIENGITYDVSWTGSATVTLKKNSTSGATITSGSTSPLSFTADADYELYFGSSATVTNIMVKDSRITDPTYEPYHESVEVMYEEEIHGVNLLPKFTLADLKAINTSGTWNNNVYTRNGITFTVNEDNQTVSINSGTSTAYVNFRFNINLKELLKRDIPYTVNGMSNSIGRLFIYDRGRDRVLSENHGGDSSFVLPSSTTFTNNVELIFDVNQNVTIQATTIRPMIRLATIDDSTYRPYNYQAIQNQLNAQGVLGAKNLLQNTATSQTINGVTFTVNADKSVTVNGTATADIYLNISASQKWAVGSYILSGGVSDNVRLYFKDNPQTKVLAWDKGDSPVFTVSDSLAYNCAIYVRNGYTANNVTLKPMLRLASDPDDTYQPYAMTNRELMKNKIDKGAISLTSGNNLNDVTDVGLYIWGSSLPVNAPENKTWYSMFVTRNDTDVTQIAYKRETIYQRSRTGSASSYTWSPWYKFTGTVVS